MSGGPLPSPPASLPIRSENETNFPLKKNWKIYIISSKRLHITPSTRTDG